jgi:maltooligosyltrehalose trehalohydrolase
MTEHHQSRPEALGATRLPDGSWQFVVWAPHCERVELHRLDDQPEFQLMKKDALGYHHVRVLNVAAGSRYFYRLDGSQERPDPASRFQTEGVHGPSAIVDLQSSKSGDASWKGLPLDEMVFYELHVGTFTPEGTLSGLIPHLDRLVDLGINTLELMPLAQFPGNRNWGYDGVYPFAVQNSYGSPHDFQTFVNAAHSKGLAVALDVVYNHLGPEGNYLAEYGPYFTDRYHTPWGAALNFDGPYSDEVRHFFVQNALYWIENFHIDALRLDAIHGIFDASAFPFLAELSSEIAAFSARAGRKIHLIAESDLNDARVLRPVSEGGQGMDAQWSDDFHHSVHTLLTNERTGYYADFGELCHLSTTLKQGWCYSGQYSQHRRRRHGNKPPSSSRSQFVVCSQNHDQVGNRARGERLSRLVSFESLKLAAGVTLLSPFVPLLFMGEEYGEVAPFQYFTSHGDPGLAEAVRRERKAEFDSFDWKGQVPDPQAESTFAASKLNHGLAHDEPHRTLWRFYHMMLNFRREHQLGRYSQADVVQYDTVRALLNILERSEHQLAALFHFGEAPAGLPFSLPPGRWNMMIDSADLIWMGPGSSVPAVIQGAQNIRLALQPRSFVVWERAPRRPESV